jgi:hypothetical protein
MSKKHAVILLILAPILFFAELIFSGKALFWGLPELQFYPWRVLAFEQILSGYMPLWNPYNGLGSPLLANYQTAIFYPATGLLFIFYWLGHLEGMVWGHMLINVVHVMLAGIGMYRVCTYRGVSFAGSTLAGITFSLGGYLVARFGFFSMVWTMAWFPWIFLLTMRLYEKEDSRFDFFKLILAISMMLLAGHAQLSWYILLYCGLWLISRITSPLSGWGKKVWQFALACIFAFAISAIQLLPTAEYLLQSQRSTEVDISTALTYSFWPWHLLNFINPSLFGNPAFGNYWGYGAFWEDSLYLGLLPFLLLLGSIILLFKSSIGMHHERKEKIFSWIMILIGILFSLGKNLFIFPWLYKNIPTFDMFNAPARYMIWVVFSACILAATTFDHWKKPQGKVLYWVRLGTASGFGVGIGATWMMINRPNLEPTFIAAAFQISVLTFLCGFFYLINPNTGSPDENPKKILFWQLGVVLFVFLDLFILSFDIIPAQDLRQVELFQNSTVGNSQRIYWDEGNDYTFRYDTVLDFKNYGNTLTPAELAESQLANVNIYNHVVSMNNFEPMRLKTYDRFIQMLRSLTPDKQKKLLAGYGIDTLIQLDPSNANKLERIAITPDDIIQFSTGIQISPSIDGFIKNTKGNQCITLMSTERQVITSEEGGKPCERERLEIKELVWEGNIISFNTDIHRDGWLLVNDTQASGWSATVDGDSVPISLANGFVKAIPISAGFHSVKFQYMPISFLVGALFSLVSLFSLGILYIKNKRKIGVSHDS